MTTKRILRALWAGAVSAISMVTLASPLAAASPIDVGAIRSALIDKKIDMRTVEVASADGIVILKGTVADSTSYLKLEPAVKELGYTRVANLVRVVAIPDDSALRRAVERELSLTRGLDGCQLQVTAKGGRVTIRGTVQTELQIDAAKAVARRVHGVSHVETQLKNL